MSPSCRSSSVLSMAVLASSSEKTNSESESRSPSKLSLRFMQLAFCLSEVSPGVRARLCRLREFSDDRAPCRGEAARCRHTSRRAATWLPETSHMFSPSIEVVGSPWSSD